MNSDLAKELEKNTDIMESTFKNFNLQVLQYKFKPYDDDPDYADCQFILEVSSIEGSSLSKSVYLKVNLYEESGDIYCSESKLIWDDKFVGYDTYTIGFCNDGKTLHKAKTARVFLVPA